MREIQFYSILEGSEEFGYGGSAVNSKPTTLPDVAERDCPDCDGTGWFVMPDDTKEIDIRCKGTGRVNFNLPM